MGKPADDFVVVKIEEKTPGGNTYYVRAKDSKYIQKLCFRKIHDSDILRCMNDAGKNTNHSGTGACKYHGGNNGAEGQRIVTGRQARITRTRLAESIQDYMTKDRDKLLDLTYELAASKAIFDEFLENFPTTDQDDYDKWFYRFTTLIGTLSNLVERISRADNRNTLTAAQVLYLRATVADILMKYITEPSDRDRAARELASRMGGDIEVALDPLEYSLPRLEG